MRRQINKLAIIFKLIFNYRVPGKYTTIRKDDIFLISYPKSGNTWMRFLLGNLVYSNGVDFKNLNRLVPDIYKVSRKELDSIESSRIIKSHEKYKKGYSKVIYIFRDPRDVAVSYYYWYRKFRPNRYKSFDDFLMNFLQGKVAFGLWSDHVQSWLKASELSPDKIVVVKYEDLKANAFKELIRVAKFCNFNVSDQNIITAVEKSDFDAMKKKEEEQEAESFLKGTNLDIKFVRSAKSEWKEKMNVSQIEKMNKVFGKLIKEHFN